MSLNQTKTMPVFEKTCTFTPQSSLSFTNLPIAPRQPPTDVKKYPIELKKINPMIMG